MYIRAVLNNIFALISLSLAMTGGGLTGKDPVL